MNRLHISVKGIVQGVGFRPFVYNLAKSLNIKGYVRNTSEGVVIEAEGECLADFLISIQNKYPPLARIDSIETRELPPKGYKDFIIVESLNEGSFTLISPDISVCDDCLKELFEPSDRRYLYPFINCTNCGPRYSITEKVPYDRPNTTMSIFRMCPQCLAEYHNPADRRFHAQPNACHECGPQLQFKIQNLKFKIEENENPLKATIELLKHGAIVAIKGLGGFHLCCDATNEDAVKRLRRKKRRSNKPFALMSPDIETISQFCEISEEEEKLLTDRRRPIVLLKKKTETICQKSEVKGLSEYIAPNNKYLGFMLPYTPLHYLLFYYPLTSHFSFLTSHFHALVMTSGNISEEPIVISNAEALTKLSDIADAFLLYNRDIFMRVDDSVMKVTGFSVPASQFIRRARGYVPEPIQLKDEGPDRYPKRSKTFWGPPEVLGCGADIKNTFTITKGNYAIVSQHIGDMENYETLIFFKETLNNLKQVYRANPVAIAYDLHPNYLSTQWALRLKDSNELQVTSDKLKEFRNLQSAIHLTRHSLLSFYGIQHHYAHIASVMAEHGLKEKVIGVAFDGTGYGEDGNLWGGEFLVCDLHGFERVANFRYIPLPGGERAIRECWRTALSYIVQSYDFSRKKSSQHINSKLQTMNFELIWDCLDSIGFIERYGRDRIGNILRLLDNRQFSPLSSGAGRLFDAVSAITGICDENTFEGEAAIALENMVRNSQFTVNGEAYPFEILDGEPMIVDFSKMIIHILGDVRHKRDKSLIAVKFHNTLIGVIAEVVSSISQKCGIKRVALSGGVFQNSYILKGAFTMLSFEGFEVYTNEKVPCNDAGISLGQAYIARERAKKDIQSSN